MAQAGSATSAFLADAPSPSDGEVARECASALRLSTESMDAEEEGARGEAAAAGAAEGEAEGSAAVAPSPSADQLAEWRALLESSSAAAAQHRLAFSRVPSGATRAAWPHGATGGPCETYALDHVLYTPRTLRLASLSSTLDDDAASAAEGLPNGRCPPGRLPTMAGAAA